MVEINWSVLVLLITGLFALTGYYRGWGKEAVTTIFLTILAIFSQLPTLAQLFINLINFIIAIIWRLLSELDMVTVTKAIEVALGLDTNGGTPQLDASDGYTWIVILIVFLSVAIVSGRYTLPDWSQDEKRYQGYIVTPRANIYGALLGGLNSWLIISLVRVYLDGSKLPKGNDPIAADLSGRVILQATDVPIAGINDSFLPWFFTGLAILLLIMVINTRVAFLKDKEGFRKTEYRAPLGYIKTMVIKKEKK